MGGNFRPDSWRRPNTPDFPSGEERFQGRTPPADSEPPQSEENPLCHIHIHIPQGMTMTTTIPASQHLNTFANRTFIHQAVHVLFLILEASQEFIVSAPLTPDDHLTREYT